MTGLPPFKMASPRDPHYGQFCINRHFKFWDSHSQRTKIDFSEEFKDLVNAMLSYDPTHRPSIPEIYSHPWVRGEMPSHEQICHEFEKRKKYVDRAMAKEMAAKQREKERAKKVPNMAFGPIRAHRGSDDTAPVTNTTWTDIATRFADEKNSGFVFSEVDSKNIDASCLSSKTLKETDFLNAIYWIAENLGAHVILEKNNKMKIIKTIDDENVEVKAKFYNDEQGVKYTEFFKKEGPIMSYYGFVGDIKDEFEKLTSM